MTGETRSISPRRVMALTVKESRQVVRDPSSILIAFVLPLILLFLFGYGVSLDSKNLRIGIVVQDPSPETHSLILGFAQSRYFTPNVGPARQPFMEELRAGRLSAVVVIPNDFSVQQAARRRAPIQVLTDGSQPNTAALAENYIRGVWENWLRQRTAEGSAAATGAIALEPRFWFNEALDSRRFLVPGAIAIIMTVIGTLLTALVVAREWERGTMEALLSTPIGIFELLIGKLVPYFFLGLASMLFSVGVAMLLFDLPLRGSVFALVGASAAFMLAALGQGLLISTVARNQFLASQLALITGFLPSFLLSGFIFEIGSMPTAIQWLTLIVPARYLVTSLQTVFLAGDIWPLLFANGGAILAIAAVFYLLIIRRMRRRVT